MEYVPALRPGASQSVLHYAGTKNVARAFADFEEPSLTESGFHTWAVHPDGPFDKVMDGRDAHPDALPPVLPGEYIVDYVRVWVRPGSQ